MSGGESFGTSTAIRITSGSPSDTELAALVAVLSSAAAAPVPAVPSRDDENRWGSPAHMLRRRVVADSALLVNAGY
ncbi:MAG: acyl-CoA carboxylase epsilon subunit [Rhodococcus sp. (in: high G+C Gram-positive bacteria)]|uniref:acyl-CoA carboxylase epsilon subunit n=1 Tax=Rhodococcus sp. TaxID=1831 RepID=UPI003BAEFB79